SFAGSGGTRIPQPARCRPGLAQTHPGPGRRVCRRFRSGGRTTEREQARGLPKQFVRPIGSLGDRALPPPPSTPCPPSSVFRLPSSVFRPPSSVLRSLFSVLRPLSSVLRPPSSVFRPPFSVLCSQFSVLCLRSSVLGSPSSALL